MVQSAINLAALPAPVVVEQLEYETIVDEITADLIARGLALTPPINLAPALALESEPLTIAVEAFAYRELNLRNQFNLRAQANMLAYATGADLDNLAANLGVTRKAGESDTALRARAVEAPSGWAVAGPLAAYDYIARNADPTVADVNVTSPEPGQVLILVLSTGPTGVADAALLASVAAALTPDNVRPFTDEVLVQSAATVVYNVAATIDVAQGPDPTTVQSASMGRVSTYAAGQRKIGAAISLRMLGSSLVVSGVTDYELTSPLADIAAVAGVAPILGTLAITPSVDGGGE